MQIEITITAEQICNLMISAIESGDPVTTASKGGWCSGIYYKTKRHKPPRGPWYANPSFWGRKPQVTIHEYDEHTGRETRHKVSYHTIRAGLVAMVAKYPRRFADILTDDADACTADVFLQCICFGELKYG